MNILILHPSAVPHDRPGMHRVENLFSPLLETKKITSVDVITSSYLHHGGYTVDLRKETSQSGIQYVYVPTREYGNILIRSCSMIDYYRNGYKYIKREIKKGEKKYDYIYASSPHFMSLMLGLRISKKYNIPLIVEVRDYWPEVFFTAGIIRENGLPGYTLRILEKKIYSHAQHIILLKPGDSEYFKEKRLYKKDYDEFIEKTYYMNNGVNCSLFKQYSDIRASPIKKSSNQVNVIYAGSLRKTNEIEIVLEAMKTLAVESPNVILHVYGEGPDANKVKEYQKFGNVRYHGIVNPSELVEIYSKMDFALFHYSQEKYNWNRGLSSNKVFEYLAAGLPIVQTFKVGVDIHKDYNKAIILSYENTADSVANAIKNATKITEKEYQNKSKVGMAIAEEFDYKKIANDFFEKILEGGK